MPRLHFLTWDLPLAPQVAAWLLERAEGHPGCPDLSAFLVLVPTAESGRILRAALLHQSQRAALLPPEILTPAQWLPASDPSLASPTESRLAWIDVLLHARLADFPYLIPQPPPHQDLAWASPLAHLLAQLQEGLLDNACSIRDVPQRAADLPEAERWHDLARLENLWSQKLRQLGLRDRTTAWQAFADHPTLPHPARRVVLAAVPDPIPCLLHVLERIPETDVLIHAPADAASRFDSWGRPLASQWNQQPLDWDASPARLHVLDSEETLTSHAAALALAHPQPAAALLGLARESLAPLLSETLPQAHNPAGEPAHTHELWGWLDALTRWLDSRSLPDLAALLRHPTPASAWTSQGAPPQTTTLAALQRFLHHHLARSEESLQSISPDDPADRPLLLSLATATRHWRNHLESPHWLSALQDLAATTWTRRPARAAEHDFAQALFSTLRRQAALARHLPAIPTSTHLALALAHHAASRLPLPRSSPAIEMKGWIELPWDPRPHLILCGLQEGDVPYHSGADLFLSDNLRRSLGLRSADDLLARDAFIFQTLAASRRSHGRLDVLTARFTHQGEPLQPSRLLLLCPDHELPARTIRLFQETQPASSPIPPPSAPIPLHLPPPPPRPATISVTRFKLFLKSPLLFHLQRNLGWEEVDPHKNEMDARDFGSLAHAALEAMGRDPTVRTSTSADQIAAFLRHHTLQAATRRFGTPLPLGIEIQLDSLIARLSRFARIQAASTAEGWRIIEVEKSFEIPLGHWTLTGKIDRIDRHPDGRTRLLDYKTSNQAHSPEKAHLTLATPARRAKAPPQAAFLWHGKDHLWLDLQLPLYAHFGATLPDVDPTRLTCGYIQLPRALEEVAIDLWGADTAALAGEAVACATRILATLDAGTPPLTLPAADDWKKEPWSSWFPGGPDRWIATPSTP